MKRIVLIVFFCIVLSCSYVSAFAVSAEDNIMQEAFAIISQPDSINAKDQDTVTLQIGAEGTDLSYQWQYSMNNGDKWHNCSSAGGKTARFSFKMYPSIDGRLYRCIIVDASGNKIVSDSAVVRLINEPKMLSIISQPKDVVVDLRQKVYISIQAVGDDLSYKWQYSNNNGVSWNNVSYLGASNEISFTMSESLNNREYRCVVTDGYGNNIISRIATVSVKREKTPLRITSHPESVTLPIGQRVTLAVSASGDNLTYRWQFSTNNAQSWINTSVSTGSNSSFGFKMSDALSGRLYRCIVTDSYGDSICSNYALVKVGEPVEELSIITQPVDIEASDASRVALTIEASGDGLQYQWQYSINDEKNWYNCTSANAKSTRFEFQMSSGIDGRKYRCIVKDNHGNSLMSREALISLVVHDPQIIITSQPENCSAAEKQLVVFSVAAEGNGLQYQWQYSVNEGSSWMNCSSSGSKTSIFSFYMLSAINNRLYRCIIQNENGEAVISDSARILYEEYIPSIVITKQPGNVRVTNNSRVVLSTSAEGGNLRYQWQYSTNAGASWMNCSSVGSTTDTFSFSMLPLINGRLYRCTISNDSGEKVHTDSASITLIENVDPEITINQQPSETIRVKDKNEVVLSVIASGNELSYQWQYSLNSGSSWINCSSSGAKTESFSFRMLPAIDGRLYRCVISDKNGYSVASNASKIVLLSDDESYKLPTNLTLTNAGTVSFTIAETKPHTIMLGVYGEKPIIQAKLSMFANTYSDGAELLAVLPISIDGQTSYTTNISNFFEVTGNYYVVAKAVASVDEDGAHDMGVGTAVSSNTIYFTRPENSLDAPERAFWDSLKGRATWDAVEGAASYQVMLYSGNQIIASRNINTTYFDFSTGWIDFAHIIENQYTFTVTAMSPDITTISNSPESAHSDVLTPVVDADRVVITTQPVSRYVSLNDPTTISIGAVGVGVTYEWYVNGQAVSLEDDTSINLDTSCLGETSVYCIVRDAFNTEVKSDTAVITVIDDSLRDHIITVQPQDQTVEEGLDSALFTVETDLSALYTIEYTWYRSNISEVRNNSGLYHVDASRLNNGVQVYCVVKATAPTGKVICEEQSATATLYVTPADLKINLDLESSYWLKNDNILHIGAYGDNISYQWYVNGEAAAYGTSDTFMLPSLISDYTVFCRVSNGTRFLDSATATVHVGDNPATSISNINVWCEWGTDHFTVGDRGNVSIEVAPYDTTSTVVWKSSDESVLTVGNTDFYGYTSGTNVIEIGASFVPKRTGTATITATVDGFTLSIDVLVDCYKVVFDPNGGQFENGSSAELVCRVAEDEPVTLPRAYKEGDTFLGWTRDGQNIVNELTVTGYTKLFAKWEMSTEQEDKELDILQDLAENQYSKIGTNALFEVVTNGAKVYSYQWMVNDGSGWRTYGEDGTNEGNRTRLEFPATVENNGWQFRVDITPFRDRDNVKSSAVCTLITGNTDVEQQTESFDFTQQPVSILRDVGEEAIFTVAVDKENATYQWQKDGQSIENATATSYTIKAVAVEDAGQYTCVVTIGKSTKISSAATLNVNEVMFTVTYDAAGGLFADETGERTAASPKGVYSLSGEEPTREGYTFSGWRLGESVVEDIQVSSDVRVFAVWTEIVPDPKPEITTNLAADYYPVGGEGFNVIASGLDLHYQWQTKMPDGEWTDVPDNDSNIYAPYLNASHDGMQVRCIITDQGYTPATTTISATATFHWEIHATGVEIEKVSEENAFIIGDVIEFRAVITPANSTDSVFWSSSDETVAIVNNGIVTIVGFGEAQITATVGSITSAPYCLAVNHVLVTYDPVGGELENTTVRVALGNFVPTAVPMKDNYVFNGWMLGEEIVQTLTLENNITLTASWTEIPQRTLTVSVADQTATDGHTVTFTANATWDDESKVSGAAYQWQVLNDNEWNVIECADSATYTLPAVLALNGKHYRVVVNCDGQEATAEAVLTVDSALTISTDIATELTVTAGETVNLSVAVNKCDASFQWYLNNGEDEIVIGTGASIEITAINEMNGNIIYCYVTNGDEAVQSNQLVLTVKQLAQNVTDVSIEASTDIVYGNMYNPAMGDFVFISSIVYEVDDMEGLTYVWEMSYDSENFWIYSSGEGDPGTMEYQAMEGCETDLFFRLTVNGVVSNVVCVHEYVNNVIICPECGMMDGMHESWCSMGGMTDCPCGCGMPGCTCGPECPMMGGEGSDPNNPL